MILGINLSAVEKESTGICVIGDSIEEINELRTDSEIIQKTESVRPDIVCINTPLTFPSKGSLRKAEEELENRNISFIVPKGLLKAEKLVMRGIGLKESFEKKGMLVVEVSTEAFYEIARLPRDNKYLEIKRLLKLYGLVIDKRSYSNKELDAIATAFMGRLFLEAKVEFLGDEEEGHIIVPKTKNNN